jgi:hypothetical protein
MGTYCLSAVGNRSADLPISEIEYLEIAAAREFLATVNSFEEKFFLLLENYAEFEKQLLDLALDRMIFADFQWFGVQDDLLTVNRRLANLLTASRLYLDHVDRGLIGLFGQPSPETLAVRLERSTQYDSVLGYRVMEQIRNHLQHRGLPINSLSYPMQVDGAAGRGGIAHGIRLKFSIAELRKDVDLKSTVISELESEGKEILATPLVRDYFAGLAHVHKVVQSVTDARAVACRTKLIVAMATARDQCGESSIGYVAVAEGDDGKREEVQIFAEFLDRRSQLATLCRRAADLSGHYVSGK